MSSPIQQIMEEPLPSIAAQRRKVYRPSLEEVQDLYDLINYHIFDYRLQMPTIVARQMKNTWGFCQWLPKEENGSWCHIHLNNKWYCKQWLVDTLAHEMVHQYQWDIHRWELLGQGIKISEYTYAHHGKSFYAWRNKFKVHGLYLKKYICDKRWFKYQTFAKS